ncbi:DUF4181 domain-containing protein [Salimicrobium flavidum]|nr:DUF4181 domain-containing protein [Salimicrobium flavidum]
MLASIGLLLFLFNVLMRKLLNVEKKSLFSYGHVNDKHTTVDWTIRLGFIITLIVGFAINEARSFGERLWFLKPYTLTFIFILILESTRAFMEWKYAKNRNDYIFTLSQLGFISLILITVFTTDFFGWMG